jgi:hypothetical protein
METCEDRTKFLISVDPIYEFDLRKSKLCIKWKSNG